MSRPRFIHMGWTNPRLLADRNQWFDIALDHEGPACYEIGTDGPRGGDIKWHYVGETQNEKWRMTKYGRDGSHLSKVIRSHIRNGMCIYYRAWAHPSKVAAKHMQDNLLRRWEYDWNSILNVRN